MKVLLKILDWFFLLRPTLFYPVWIFYLTGYWGGSRFDNSLDTGISSLSLAGVMVVLTMIMGGSFILNQIRDQETDRANGKLFLLANQIIQVREAYIEAVILILIGVLCGFMMAYQVGIGLILLILIAGWLYNYPPTVWKNRPVMGLLINALGGGIIYNMGWIAGGGNEWVSLRSLAYVFAVMAVYLNTTLPDIAGDKKTGKITFGVKYGVAKTAMWALILETTTISLALIFRDWLLFFPALIIWPFFIVAAFRKTLSDTIRATKFSVLALALAVCIYFPWYFILVVLVFFMAKWYYRKRFHFDYPNFKGA